MIRFLALCLYYGIAQHLPHSYWPISFKADAIRRFLCRRIFAHCGQDVHIDANVRFGTGVQMRVGNRSALGFSDKFTGPITIGSDVMVGPEVFCQPSNHRFDRLDIPMKDQGSDPDKPIVIGDDVWIGARVIILPGVRIGRGVVIGAGAIVTKDIPDYAIAAGNPARVLRYRTGQPVDGATPAITPPEVAKSK